MKILGDRFRAVMAAITFAEAGEAEAACEFIAESGGTAGKPGDREPEEMRAQPSEG